jgi:hypothetical protein
VARAATAYVAAVEPNTPLMTETGETPHAVADQPADATHLPLASASSTPCHPPLPRRRPRNQSLLATLPNTAVAANRRRTVRVVSTLWHSVHRLGFRTPQLGASDATGPPANPLPHTSVARWTLSPDIGRAVLHADASAPTGLGHTVGRRQALSAVRRVPADGREYDIYLSAPDAKSRRLPTRLRPRSRRIHRHRFLNPRPVSECEVAQGVAVTAAEGANNAS